MEDGARGTLSPPAAARSARREPPPAGRRYAVALVLTVLAVWARYELTPLVEGAFPFGTLVAAVAIASWYGGTGPGLLTFVLGTIACWWFFVPAFGSPGAPALQTLARLLLATINNLVVAALGGSNYDARWRAERLAREAEQRAEREEAAERRFRALFEGAPVGICVGRAGRLHYVNRTFVRLFGYDSADDLVGREAAELAAPGTPAEAIIRERGAGRSAPSVYDGMARRRDGSTFPVHVEVSELELDEGPAVVAYLIDTTERERAAAAVRESEARLRRIVESGMLGIAQWNGERVTEANDAFLDLLGYTREDVAAGRIRHGALTPPEHVAADRRATAEALAHGSCRPYVKEFFRKDGSRVPVLVGGTILPDRRNGVFFVLDRTAQEAAEAALRIWADAVEHATLGIAIAEPGSGHVRFANPAFAEMHGMTVDEIVGSPIADLFPEREREHVAEHAARAERDGHYGFESWHVRRDGSEFPVAIDVTTVRGPDGAPRYRIANVQDISERRRIEDQLRQAARMEAVGQLAGGVAHDYNNLTLVILGYADFALRRLAADHPAAADVREIRQAAERAARLTSQLLAFSRRQVLQPTVLDPNQVVGELTRMLGRLLGEHIELALHLAPAAGHVRADRGSLEQVLVNLAVNARDAMPRGGRLTIATGAVDLPASQARELGDLRPGPHVRITVHDTGSGMDEATQARIFEPFFTTKPVGRGTGLGLAMVYGTIQQSGGGIAVTSAPGEGATFELYLPRVADDAAEEERREPPPPRGRERILLVEDDPSVRGLAARTLEDLGYAVRAAGSADEAREVAAGSDAEAPELLVTDVIMPGDSGRLLAEDLRSRLPDLRVLFMSGYTDDAVLAHGVRRASVHFLQKPFTPDGLARKVREVLDAPLHRGEPRGS